MNNTYEIRFIEEKDTREVLDIYTYYAEHTSVSFEYETPNLQEYAARIKTNTEQYPWLVCLCEGKVIGFAYGSTHRYRTAYQWSPESTIYLAPDFRGKGIGKILYECLFSMLKIQGFYNVFAGVVIPNDKSVGLHKTMGFEEIGIFKNIGYKHGQWHNTQWFQLKLQEHHEHPVAPLKPAECMGRDAFTAILKLANQKAAAL